MAESYRLDYDWARRGPVPWTVSSLVTLQVDLRSATRGDLVEQALQRWWGRLRSSLDVGGLLGGGAVAYAGGARFPRPVRVDEHLITAWVVSAGEDAFDTISSYADEIQQVAEGADPAVEIGWTELPHRQVGESSS